MMTLKSQLWSITFWFCCSATAPASRPKYYYHYISSVAVTINICYFTWSNVSEQIKDINI